MPLPRLLHPIAIGIRQLSRAKTLVDDDLREPRGDANREAAFTVPGQVKWFDIERFQGTQMGPEGHSDGYVLFRLPDLRAAGVGRIHQGDRFVTMGTGPNQVEVDVYVNNLRYMGHYPDQGGPTLVRAYFKDRQPSKQSDVPIVDLGLAAVWLSSSAGGLFGILESQLAQSANVGPDLAFSLDGDPIGFDLDADGALWTFAGSPGWIRSYPGSDIQRSGSPVASLAIRTPFTSPARLFFDQAFYSGLWCLDAASALGLYAPGQLTASSESVVNPSTLIMLSIGATPLQSEPIDFAVDAAGWGYVAHKRIGGSGGLSVWALNPTQLGSSGVGVVPAGQNVGSNFNGNPSGITVATDGAVWVSMHDTNAIARFVASDLRGGGNPAPNVLITSTAMAGPTGLAFDASGNLWVLCDGASKLLRFSAVDVVSSGAKTPSLELALAAPSDPCYLKLV